jgi:hypothetical protein
MATKTDGDREQTKGFWSLWSEFLFRFIGWGALFSLVWSVFYPLLYLRPNIINNVLFSLVWITPFSLVLGIVTSGILAFIVSFVLAIFSYNFYGVLFPRCFYRITSVLVTSLIALFVGLVSFTWFMWWMKISLGSVLHGMVMPSAAFAALATAWVTLKQCYWYEQMPKHRSVHVDDTSPTLITS